uniref:C2H2-type domain-containing protein n=1 Tax=Tetraselmis sp. GSL018 TaxID=582737 RepID=A0A061RYV5_9CHLO
MRTLLREEKALNEKFLPFIRIDNGQRPPLKEHVPMLSADHRSVRCPVQGCNAVFLDAGKLALHKNDAHRDLRCPFRSCFLSFTNAAALNLHIDTKHRPKTCYEGNCNMLEFRSEPFLREHREKFHLPAAKSRYKAAQGNNVSFEVSAALFQHKMLTRHNARNCNGEKSWTGLPIRRKFAW